jgi:hypothetical protein
MNKKIFILVVFFIMALMLTACGSNPKEFSGSGISITLTDQFIEKEVIQAPLYLESTNHIFMGMRESKSELEIYNINTLRKYIDAVINNGNVNAEVETFNEDGVEYLYAYYTATVSEIEYGYMLIVMEGQSHYYSMNFGCLQKNLDDYKDTYFTWAKTIIVE